jgi:hypothetical protein
MPNTLDDGDWEIILERIKDGKCTPFLGAGACFGIVPLGADIAREWAKQYHYPLKDSYDLAKVAQFVAVEKKDAMKPKDIIQKKIIEIPPPDFKNNPNEPHSVLASLPLPVYITTNYDDFMMKALIYQHKDPKREVCRWNEILKEQPSLFDSGFVPTPANPVVFHLHGYAENLASLVLTEDDYLDFLISISKDQELIPKQIRGAFSGTSLVFLGYRLADWDFRVLFRTLVSYVKISLQRLHVSVQVVPEGDVASDAEQQMLKDYLSRYFGDLKIQVFWGTCCEFIAELKNRWEEFVHG